MSTESLALLMDQSEGDEGAVTMVEAVVTEGLDQADVHRKQWIRVTEGGLAKVAKQFTPEERCGLEHSTVLL